MKARIKVRRNTRYLGRRELYSTEGIKRLQCFRCGGQAQTQWNCCANNNYWLPICASCDVEANEVFMHFMHFPPATAIRLIRAYRKKMGLAA